MNSDAHAMHFTCKLVGLVTLDFGTESYPDRPV